jgi:hypothetical protein
MSSDRKSRIMYVLVGSLLVLFGYVLGSLKEPAASYAQSGSGQPSRTNATTSIPGGGFAVIAGSTAPAGSFHWYVVDSSGSVIPVKSDSKALYAPR